jgi:hypothetical protein
MMALFDISVETANTFQAWGWRLALGGVVITVLGVGILLWGTRVRDRDFEEHIARLYESAASAEQRSKALETENVALQKSVEQERSERTRLESRLAPRALGTAKTRDLGARLQPVLQGKAVDLIVYESLGSDVAPLSREIANALALANANVKIFTPIGAATAVHGVVVTTAADAPPDLIAAVEPTSNALRQAGLEAGRGETFPAGDQPPGVYNGPGGQTSKLRILIGARF